MIFLCLLSVACASLQHVQGAGYVVNSNQLWPLNPSSEWNADTGRYTTPQVIVPVNREFLYNIDEYNLLKGAMATINAATKNCILFDTWKTGSPNVLRVNRVDPAVGTISPICRGPLGYTGTDQTLVMVGARSNPAAGAGGCLNDQRDATRFLMNVLGVVNEFQRPDRDSSDSPMQFATGYNDRVIDSLQAQRVFDKRSEAEVSSLIDNEFDIQSVTMVSPERYAKNAADAVFQLKDGFGPVPSGVGLSQRDCEVLVYAYQCNSVCDLSGPGDTPDFTPDKITSSLFCWPTSSGSVESADPIGVTAPDYDLTKALQYSLVPEPSNVRVTRAQTIADVTDGSAVLRLKQPIRSGFRVTTRIIARENSQNVASSELQINVNCWPQFKLLANDALCGDPGKNGKTGAFLSRCERREAALPVTATCSAGAIQPLQPLIRLTQISDPDGSTLEFLGLTVTDPSDVGNEDKSDQWIYSQTARTLMLRRGTIIDPANTLSFGLAFMDSGDTTGPIEYLFQARFTCAV